MVLLKLVLLTCGDNIELCYVKMNELCFLQVKKHKIGKGVVYEDEVGIPLRIIVLWVVVLCVLRCYDLLFCESLKT